ncbi:MAG: hypothetical protein M1812_003258 [Candelaria pacifica]|nr:MAG: hypothetical protein M1812_003258 [Candelaria pacifica]
MTFLEDQTMHSRGFVMHWDFVTRITQCFELPCKANVRCEIYWRRLLIHPTAACVFAFEKTSDANPSAKLESDAEEAWGDYRTISYTKYTYDGHMVSSGGLTYRMPPTEHDWGIYPSDFGDCFTLCSGYWMSDGKRSTGFAKGYQIWFNTSTEELKLSTYPLELKAITRLWPLRTDNPGLGYTLHTLHWKDCILISPARALERQSMRILRPYESSLQVAIFDRHRDTEQVPSDAYWFCGDERILIEVGPSGFTVWSFDKNLQLANEDTEYRKGRDARAHESIPDVQGGIGLV